MRNAWDVFERRFPSLLGLVFRGFECVTRRREVGDFVMESGRPNCFTSTVDII
jgi:hypothetical protein